MNEHDICWLRNADYAEITAPSGTAWKSKIFKYAKLYPGQVLITSINKDGSIVAHIPVNWIKCSPPRKVSDEQKEIASERFKKMWDSRRTSNLSE